MSSSSTIKGRVSDLVKQVFPEIKYIIAYGSVAVPQSNYDASQSMLDLIFVVDDAPAWHHENKRRNKSHYSGLGAHLTGSMFSGMGAGLHYNTMLRIQDIYCKYGVIEEECLADDLLNWRTLYVAGRLQKPVLLWSPGNVPSSAPKALQQAMQSNREMATAATLLMMMDTADVDVMNCFNVFLKRLVGLTFLGDFRMLVGGEDPKKIENIASGQRKGLEAIYRPIVKRMDFAEKNHNQHAMIMHTYSLLSKLPASLRLNPIQTAQQSPRIVAERVGKAIGNIIRMPAITQAARSIITAGPLKSIKYSLAKIQKGRKNVFW